MSGTNKLSEMLSQIGESRIVQEIGAELKEKFELGKTELAAALLRGHDAFVMYQKGDNEGVHGKVEELGNQVGDLTSKLENVQSHVQALNQSREQENDNGMER